MQTGAMRPLSIISWNANAREVFVTGLRRMPSNTDMSKLFWFSTSAVTAMTTTRSPSGVARISRASSSPDMPGIHMSVSTRSGFASRSFARASSPESA